ncbi:MAG TPA: glucan 1,4-alpha-glucosidase, partial [Thermodesulfobacteriota bacterium]
MSVAYKPQFPFPSSEAFGRPGVEPLWQRASKQGVGTALSPFSRVWFTIADGVVTETYYPDAGTACVKDLKFLVTDSRTFFNEEWADTEITRLEQVHEYAPGYVITNTAKSGLWSVTKRIVTDPQANSLVINTSFKAIRAAPSDFRLFVLLAPHIGNSGYGNSARCAPYGGRNYLLATRNNISLALAADRPFLRMSAGYSGSSDGWHDLKDNLELDWGFERAPYGNVALTAELVTREETNLILSFGKDEVEAVLETERTLSRKYHDIEREYIR